MPTAELELRLEATEPSEEEIELTLARVGITELRANNDRGGDLEPRMENVGAADLVEGTTIDFGSVPPATYGRVTMRLEEGDWGPAVELELSGPGGAVRVTVRDAVDVDARCEAPALLSPSSSAVLELRLDAQGIWDALPEPPTGGEELVVDEGTAPDALDAVERVLRDGWSLECEGEETEGSTEALEHDEG